MEHSKTNGLSMYELEQLNLPLSTRRDIAHQFWGGSSPNSKDSTEDDAYFSYFEKQCRFARQNDDPDYPICTQANISDIAHRLKAGEVRGKILQSVILKVQEKQVADREHIEYAIDLTVRLWLMVHVDHARRGITGLTPMPWPGGSLNSALAAHFRHELVLTNSIKLEKIFNACNIERIADVRIQWTPNLVDHLRFIEDGKHPVLNIFYHAAFLYHHRTNVIFPPGLILETLQTIALLLPMHDPACKKWYLAQHTKLSLDPLAITCGQLKLEERQIAHFKYWHDRLVIIKQYFDESQPRTFKQWWYDDRKRVQWFWVAIVLVVCTVLFGIIQCFEGGWQIWKAYHP